MSGTALSGPLAAAPWGAGAERLGQSLEASSKAAEDILTKALRLQASLSAFSQSREEFAAINRADNQQQKPVPLSPASAGESVSLTWLRDLQEDNEDLRTVLAEMQQAMDTIMAKHRSQTQALIAQQEQQREESERLLQEERKRAEALEQEVARLTGKLSDMTGVLCLAYEQDGAVDMEVEEELERLRTENAGLRALLAIAASDTSPIPQ